MAHNFVSDNSTLTRRDVLVGGAAMVACLGLPGTF